MRRRLSPALGVLVLALVPARPGARAQDHGVLHEYVPHLAGDEGALVVAEGDAQPAMIVSNGEVLAPPNGGGLRSEERPMTPDPGAGERHDTPGRRSPTFRPDRVTELESTLGYYEVFSPAIAPYKRVSALDAVTLDADGRTPVLVVADRRRTRLTEVGAGAASPDGRPRDRFWGSVVLELEGGTEVPLPSVSPESRLLTIEVEPTTILRVEKDSADNWVAVVDRPAHGALRVTYLTDAPRDYFARSLPDVRVDARADEIPAPLPASVQRRAEAFAAERGLSRRSTFRDAVTTLVGWFRSFEESETPPADTGDVYLDLARGKKGVCRHRAYAFTITALALGIRARFVENEAHAWVEVAVPGGGWMRVDLGGAANGLEAHNAAGTPLYRPAAADALPRPPEYARSYTQGTDVQGLRDPDARTAMTGLGAGSGAPPQPGALPTRPDHAQPSPPAGGVQGSPPGAIPVPPSASNVRIPLAVAVNTAYRDVFRGRELLVTGRVTDANTGLGASGQRIEVSLSAPHGDRGLLLGVTVSRDGGDFRASFGVPPDVPVGDYRLTVVAPGDARHLPGVAR